MGRHYSGGGGNDGQRHGGIGGDSGRGWRGRVPGRWGSAVQRRCVSPPSRLRRPSGAPSLLSVCAARRCAAWARYSWRPIAGGVTAAVAAGRVPGAPGGLLVCGAERGCGGVVGGRGGDAYGKEVFLPRHRPTVWRRRGCPQRRHPGDERGQRGVRGSVGGWRRVRSGDGQHADCGGQGGGGGWLARGCLWRWRRGWGDRGGGWRSSVALPPTTAGAATAQRGQRGCCCVGGKALTTRIIVPCWEPAMAGVKMAVAPCRRGAGMPRWR